MLSTAIDCPGKYELRVESSEVHCACEGCSSNGYMRQAGLPGHALRVNFGGSATGDVSLTHQSIVITSGRPQVNTDLEHINEQATDTFATTITVTPALNIAAQTHNYAVGSPRLGSPAIAVQAAKMILRTGLPKPAGQPHP